MRSSLALLLLLPAWSSAAQPKVTTYRGPYVAPVVQIAPLPTLNLSLTPANDILKPQTAPVLQTVPVLQTAPQLVATQIAPPADPYFTVTGRSAAELPWKTPDLPNTLEEAARKSALRFDGISGKAPEAVGTRVVARIAELADKYRHEKAHTDKEDAHGNTGLGHAAEIMVLHAEGRRLVNVSEKVYKDGEEIGEIDAETATHLIEIASGRLDSGKKNKIQQMTRFLRAEAKRRGKAILFYIDPKRADPDTMERLKKIGAKAGVQVEFKPIPWDMSLLGDYSLN